MLTLHELLLGYIKTVNKQFLLDRGVQKLLLQLNYCTERKTQGILHSLSAYVFDEGVCVGDNNVFFDRSGDAQKGYHVSYVLFHLSDKIGVVVTETGFLFVCNDASEKVAPAYNGIDYNSSIYSYNKDFLCYINSRIVDEYKSFVDFVYSSSGAITVQFLKNGELAV